MYAGSRSVRSAPCSTRRHDAAYAGKACFLLRDLGTDRAKPRWYQDFCASPAPTPTPSSLIFFFDHVRARLAPQVAFLKHVYTHLLAPPSRQREHESIRPAGIMVTLVRIWRPSWICNGSDKARAEGPIKHHVAPGLVKRAVVGLILALAVTKRNLVRAHDLGGVDGGIPVLFAAACAQARTVPALRWTVNLACGTVRLVWRRSRFVR